MRVLVLAAALAVVVGFGFASTPAKADCAADIAAMKPEITAMTDAKKKKAAMKQLASAQKSAKAKKEKACMATLAKVKKTM